MLHRIIYRHPKPVLVIACAVTLVALILATRIKLDVDLFALLPDDHPSTRAFFEVAEGIGLQSLLIVLLEAPSQSDPRRSEAFADLMAGHFSQSPFVSEVEYKSKGPDSALFLEVFMGSLPLFLREQDLEKLAEKLSDEGIRQQIWENKRHLMTPFSVLAQEWIQLDPLAFREFIENKIAVPPGKADLRSHEGYYRTKNGEIYFLLVKPKEPPQNLVFSKALMAEAHRLEKITTSDFSEKFGDPPEGIRVSYGGGYAIAVHDEAITKKDIQVMLITSFLGVMILFYLSFKGARILLFVAVSLAFSLFWTLGFAGLAFQRLNLLTLISSCVLIGLGIDFAIHLVNRYFGPDKAGLNRRDRLAGTFHEISHGLTVGAVTTAVAFYSIAVSDFRAFRELGILTGTGILFCLLAMLFVLPSLLMVFPGATAGGREISVVGFGMKALLNRVSGHPRAFLTGTLVIVGILGFLGTRITFDDNLKNFRVADSPAFLAQDKFTAWFGGSSAEVLVVAEAKSDPEVMEVAAKIDEALEGMKESGEITGFRSISRFFLPHSQQETTLEFIRNHPSLFDPDRIKKTFYEALEENGFNISEGYVTYMENLSASLKAKHPFLATKLKGPEIEKFLGLFVFKKGSTFKVVTYVTPPRDLWSHADTNRFRDGITRRLSEKSVSRSSYSLTGASLLTGDLKALVIRNLQTSLGLASVGIIVVLFIVYRRVHLVFLCLSPSLLGFVSLFGIMVVSGLSLNFFNIIVLTMIIGIGIDDGVHLTNAFSRAGGVQLIEEITHTGRAIVLTTLATLVGFGSISLSHYPGLKSMGYVAVIGMSACLFTSIIILPSLFAMLRGVRKV